MLRLRVSRFLRARLGPGRLPLRLIFWDDDSFDLGSVPTITITLTTPSLLRSLMRGNIEALGDAYVTGTLNVEGRLSDIIAVGVDLARRVEQFG